jgi:hypothetical protein
MSRMTYRVMIGLTVAPFIVMGWILSVYLSHAAVQAAEESYSIGIIADD